jgi:hypothetical protein
MGVKPERNESEKVPFKLARDTPSHVYRVLTCAECQEQDALRIVLADNGQWEVTCTLCYESACMIGEIINELG